ncbi:MAG: chemotaxis-specific protein-glutamate methyltransferase CheB [Planctomycetota bacterium]|nr:chemotaxis-specific protein-glutamate methyltransferase CheB [Planctomycetota bacterium]
MPRIRVLIAEDSVTIRKWLVEALSREPDLEVVGEAEDGRRAIELCQSLRPDVVTMDMMMPVMTGLAATEYIMAYCPTPILIVSASTNRGELFRTYDALAAGAVDVIEKPQAEDAEDAWVRRCAAALRVVSRIKVITHPRARLGLAKTRPSTAWDQPEAAREAPRQVVALGASTGGPGALAGILGALPKDFALPILLVIHIGRSFAGSFAEWLDAQTALNVRYAEDGESLPDGGTVLMAPPERHLVAGKHRVHLSDAPERHSCRPSVDVLFESVAREYGARAAGFLLTGMGRDGAAGLLALRRAGAATFAQDEASCVVFGMPREAIQLGAAERVLPLDRMPAALLQLAGEARG